MRTTGRNLGNTRRQTIENNYIEFRKQVFYLPGAYLCNRVGVGVSFYFSVESVVWWFGHGHFHLFLDSENINVNTFISSVLLHHSIQFQYPHSVNRFFKK
uniref:Uncharacterized protein n=1 Tax=Cacopsylla melanoneura TaxID=428564 RepID=A0A8D9EAL0_9HEMI